MNLLEELQLVAEDKAKRTLPFGQYPASATLEGRAAAEIERLTEGDDVTVPRLRYAALLLGISKAKNVLRAAKIKLALYRDAHGGEYVGGIEYTALMREIDAILEERQP